MTGPAPRPRAPGLRLQLTSWLVGVRRAIRNAPYLRKWVILGALIGVVAGLGAIVFFTALGLGTHLFLTLIAGYSPPTPAGEGGAPITAIARPWLLPLVVGLGGLISGFIVFRWAPEAEGHGTDAAIDAYHHGPRRIRARVPLIKIVASAITIGSGGSGGREGPTAQISAGFGSFLGRLLDLDARDARIAVAVGIGSGIGAIFRAPLGGAVLGAEILYRDDVEAEALIPSFIASIVGYSIYASVEGFSPIFGEQNHATFSQPSQLLYYAIIGVAAGLVGMLYVRSFYGLTRWFRGWTIPRMVRPAIAGVAVGVIGMVLPGAMGTGYGWLQTGFGTQVLGLPLWVLLVLPFAKILTTSLSIGSGGSGGVFGPGMVIGGLLGAAIWRLLLPIAPGLPPDPAPFTIVAMMALFGSIAHAPLAVMLMVAEMTDNLSMLAPAMVAVGLATFVVGDLSIYTSQVADRSDSPAHQYRSAMPLMASITVGQALRATRCVATARETAGHVLERARFTRVPGVPVLDERGQLIGIVRTATLAQADAETVVGSLVDTGYPTVQDGDGLDRALEQMSDNEVNWVPVVESRRRLLGVLSVRDVMGTYRLAMKGTSRRVQAPGVSGRIVEATIAAGSRLAGAAIESVPWPREAVVVAVQHGDALVVPRGNVVLAEGDRVSVFAAPNAVRDVQALLSKEASPAPPPGEGTEAGRAGRGPTTHPSGRGSAG
ncbi:MAG: chloride channel protein [Chloroflexi bacterium]|nr:chloride channel protein [Chloroflexota bacterium]